MIDYLVVGDERYLKTKILTCEICQNMKKIEEGIFEFEEWIRQYNTIKHYINDLERSN